MKKITLLMIIAALSVLSACAGVKFVRTGEIYPPLPETAKVCVFSSNKPKSFEEIGIVQVKGNTLKSRVESAKKTARNHGGNGIIFKKQTVTDKKTDKTTSPVKQTKDIANLPVIQEFIVIQFYKENGQMSKPKDKVLDWWEQAAEIGWGKFTIIDEKHEQRKIQSKKILKREYLNLHRARYRELINDYETMRDKMYCGSLYPKMFYKFPRWLKPYGGSGKRLLLLTTRSGRKKLLMIVPSSLTQRIKKLRRSKEALDFVYTPLDVYKNKKRKYPLISFIKEIDK